MKETDDIKKTYNVTVVKNYKKKPGTKTLLTESLFEKIRELTVDGKSLPQIAKETGVSLATMYDWKTNNYMRFEERLSDYKRERTLKLAEDQIALLIKDKSSGIRLEASKFTLETLGKKYYSKKESNINIINVPTPILGNMLEDMSKVNVIEHATKD